MGQGTAGTISHDKNFTFKCSFVGESTRFSQDLDKYKEFQTKTEELVQDSKNNEEGNQGASTEFINKMKNKWIES